jgi:hypothetical protein
MTESSLSRRRLLALGGLLCGAGGLFAPGQARAREPQAGVLFVEGRPVAQRALVGGTELRLNGVGVRAVAWFKAFVAALYLDGPARSAAEAVAVTGPKRLQMQMLHAVPADELVKALRKGVARNTPAHTHAAVMPAMEELARLLGALGRLREGAVIDLDWDPTRGVLLRLDGTLRGVVVQAGALFPAVLLSFVGDRPYDIRLKAGLLSGRATRADAARAESPVPASSPVLPSSPGD